MASSDDSAIQCMVKAGVGLLVSFHNKSVIRVYHLETFDHLQDINIASAVYQLLEGSNRLISGVSPSHFFLQILLVLNVIVVFSPECFIIERMFSDVCVRACVCTVYPRYNVEFGVHVIEPHCKHGTLQSIRCSIFRQGELSIKEAF